MSDTSDILQPVLSRLNLTGESSNRGRNLTAKGQFKGRDIEIYFNWLSVSRDPSGRTGTARAYAGHHLKIIFPTEVRTRFFAHRSPRGASKLLAKMNRLAKLEKMPTLTNFPDLDCWSLEPSWAKPLIEDPQFSVLMTELIKTIDTDENAGFKIGAEGEIETSCSKHLKAFTSDYIEALASCLWGITHLVESQPRPQIIPKISKLRSFAQTYGKKHPLLYSLILIALVIALCLIPIGLLILFIVLIGK